MPVLAQGPLAGPPVVEGALPCWANTVPEGPALQENCPVCPAAASLQISRTGKPWLHIVDAADMNKSASDAGPPGILLCMPRCCLVDHHTNTNAVHYMHLQTDQMHTTTYHLMFFT